MKFDYKAFNQEGAMMTGRIEAESKDAAFALLQEKNLLVTFLTPAQLRLSLPFLDKVSAKELGRFTRELHFLIKSRIPLDDSLKVLLEQARNQRFKEVLTEVYNSLVSGVPLSQALSSYPDVFSQYYVKMIQIGESIGTLDEVTAYLATHLENQARFTAKVVQALTYPAIVIVIFIVTMLTLFIMVIPKIAQIFEENNLTMPLATRFFYGFSKFLISDWPYLLLVAGFGLQFLITYIKTSEGKTFLFNFFQNIPVVGQILKTLYVVRFLESFSFLVKGGVTIPDALNTVAESIDNPIYEAAIKEAAAETRQGKSISVALLPYKDLLSPLVIEAVITGEKTGQLGDILLSTSSYYFEELENKTATLSENLQPLFIVLLAGGLGFLEASLLIPILNLTKAVQSF